MFARRAICSQDPNNHRFDFDREEFKFRHPVAFLATRLLPPLERSQYGRQTGAHGHRPPHELGVGGRGSLVLVFCGEVGGLVAVVAASFCTPMQDAMGW